MNVVIDANIAIALILSLPYSAQAHQLVHDWNKAGTRIVVPQLFEYEVVSIIRQAVFQKRVSSTRAQGNLRDFLAYNYEAIAPTPELHSRAIIFAARLGQKRAYDAQYLALAERLGAELWTADKRLANGAKQAGIDWVKSIIV